MKTTHEGMNILGFRPETGNYSLEARVRPGDGIAGIGIYTHQDKMLVFAASQNGLSVSKVDDGQKLILAELSGMETSEVYLKYTAIHGQQFSFSWSTDGENWTAIPISGKDVLDAGYLATWGYSPRAGLLVKGPVGDVSTYTEVKVNYRFRFN